MKWMLVVFTVVSACAYAHPVVVGGQDSHANYAAGLYQYYSKERIPSNNIYHQPINAPLGGYQ